MNKKERKANQILAEAKEIVRERMDRKSPTIKKDIEMLKMKILYDDSRDERARISRERGAFSQMRVGILSRPVPTNMHSLRQGVIPKGQCVLFEPVSFNSVRVKANDGREGACWSNEVQQMKF